MLFARANVKRYSPGRTEKVIRTGEYKIRPGEQLFTFARVNNFLYWPGRITICIRPGEYRKLFARATIYGYSPERI